MHLVGLHCGAAADATKLHDISDSVHQHQYCDLPMDEIIGSFEAITMAKKSKNKNMECGKMSNSVDVESSSSNSSATDCNCKKGSK